MMASEEIGNWQRRIRFVENILAGLSEPLRAHLLGIEDDAELVELFNVSRDRRVFDVMRSVEVEIKRRVERGPLVYQPFLAIINRTAA